MPENRSTTKQLQRMGWLSEIEIQLMLVFLEGGRLDVVCAGWPYGLVPRD